MIISGLVNIDTEKEIKKARQCLALTMQDYCNAFHYIIDAINNDLYQKYGITSRSSLTLAQLQYEIESYRTAIRLGQS